VGVETIKALIKKKHHHKNIATLSEMNTIANGEIIILQSCASGKSLRIRPNGQINGLGKHGKKAQFQLIKTGTQTIKLKNIGNETYLRINKNVELDGLGKGGKWTEFQVITHNDENNINNNDNSNYKKKTQENKEKQGQTIISLRSVAHQPSVHVHVGILPDGSVKKPQQTGTGLHGQFSVLLKKVIKHEKNLLRVSKNGLFSSPPSGYCASKEEVVELHKKINNKMNNKTNLDFLKNGSIIFLFSTSSGKALRITPQGKVDGRGSCGPWAQFKLHLINDNSIKLQNVGDDSHYLRINPEKELDGLGSGGDWTEFQVIQPKASEPRLICLRSKAHQKTGDLLHVGIKPNGDTKNPQNTKTGRQARFYVFELN